MEIIIHYVYRLYDTSGRFIYVGRSVNPKGRRRIFERRTGISVSLEFEAMISLEKAQDEERRIIREFRPLYNKIVQSTPTRIGQRNSTEHNQAISKKMSGRKMSEVHKAKLWAERSRISQFNDPAIKERHRLACQAAANRRYGKGEV